MPNHPRHVVPKGTIRAIMNRTRKLRVPMTTPLPNDARSRARSEVETTIPVFDTTAGLRELGDIYARARRPS